MPKPTRAREYQLEADARDDQLTRLARLRHPRVQHWWGRRFDRPHNGAWCYLCDLFIVTWDHSYPITETAREHISHHRDMHIRETLRPTPKTRSKS